MPVKQRRRQLVGVFHRRPRLELSTCFPAILTLLLPALTRYPSLDAWELLTDGGINALDEQPQVCVHMCRWSLWGIIDTEMPTFSPGRATLDILRLS